MNKEEYDKLVEEHAQKLADHVDAVIGEHFVTGDPIEECMDRIPLGFNAETVTARLRGHK